MVLCCTCMASTGNSGWDDIIVGTQAVPTRFCFDASTCPRGQLRSLFHSNFNTSVQFERQPVPPIDAACCMLLTLQPNSIYTLSTIATAVKGNHSIDPVVRARPPTVCARACVYVCATPVLGTHRQVQSRRHCVFLLCALRGLTSP